MSTATHADIEGVLDAYVRPSLASHQGNVVIVDYTNKVLRIRLTGKCSGCPSAQLTTEELISATVKEHIPVPDLADHSWTELEGKLASKGTRVLEGNIRDDLVEA